MPFGSGWNNLGAGYEGSASLSVPGGHEPSFPSWAVLEVCCSRATDIPANVI